MHRAPILQSTALTTANIPHWHETPQVNVYQFVLWWDTGVIFQVSLKDIQSDFIWGILRQGWQFHIFVVPQRFLSRCGRTHYSAATISGFNVLDVWGFMISAAEYQGGKIESAKTLKCDYLLFGWKMLFFFCVKMQLKSGQTIQEVL